ncbi:hypothetical protein ACIF8Z_17435 [Pseudomonas promysalinigenes]
MKGKLAIRNAVNGNRCENPDALANPQALGRLRDRTALLDQA